MVYFTASYLDKFKNVNNHTPHDTFEIKAIFYSRHRGFFSQEDLFKITFKFGDLTSVNIFRKINLRIKNIIKENHFNFIFNTNPIKTIVTFKIFRPDAEARRVRVQRAYDEEKDSDYLGYHKKCP